MTRIVIGTEDGENIYADVIHTADGFQLGYEDTLVLATDGAWITPEIATPAEITWPRLKDARAAAIATCH